jgi:phosphate transport system permease protein
VNRPSDWIIGMFCRLCTGATAAATLLLVGFLIVRGIGTLHTRLFFGETPWVQAVTGRQPIFEGIWPALCGTVLLVLLSAAVSIPIGTASGIYLSEYASRRTRSLLGFAVDVLAGTPSIVMGLFGFTLVLFLRRTLFPDARTGLSVAALCIALLILPYVIRTTQAALQAIPHSVRMIGPSLGFTRWQNVRHILVPSASRGILSGSILAIGRAAEDTAVILLTGAVARAGLPGSLWDKFEALPFHIYYLAAEHRTSLELDQAFGTSLVLLCLTGTLFMTASFIRRRLERRWSTK